MTDAKLEALKANLGIQGPLTRENLMRVPMAQLFPFARKIGITPLPPATKLAGAIVDWIEKRKAPTSAPISATPQVDGAPLPKRRGRPPKNRDVVTTSAPSANGPGNITVDLSDVADAEVELDVVVELKKVLEQFGKALLGRVKEIVEEFGREKLMDHLGAFGRQQETRLATVLEPIIQRTVEKSLSMTLDDITEGGEEPEAEPAPASIKREEKIQKNFDLDRITGDELDNFEDAQLRAVAQQLGIDPGPGILKRSMILRKIGAALAARAEVGDDPTPATTRVGAKTKTKAADEDDDDTFASNYGEDDPDLQDGENEDEDAV